MLNVPMWTSFIIKSTIRAVISVLFSTSSSISSLS
jgi:hypothetical protein